MRGSQVFSRKNILGILIFTLILLIINVLPLDNYYRKIINLSYIYITLALSLNLINGYTGLFSLGHYGFMAIGAYTTAVLTMSAEAKEAYYNIEPVYDWLKNLQIPLIPALIVSGVLAALLGFLISLPVLRLNDDYLAIASMGFAEIILVLIRTQFRITNGALGLKGIPRVDSYFLYGGVALVMIIFMILLTNSSKGRSLVAIREDEIAARSVGINAYLYKVISFTIGSFWAGVGGGLMAVMVGTVNQMQFTFQLTFNILLIVVLGGMGKIWGTVVAAVIVTSALELMRFLDEPMNFGIFQDGLPGLRMVVFSLLLMIVVISRTKLKRRKNRA
ncbi:MAG: branched-chain amino acid ABC transporter permease [Eubacteriales bacterium]|nr:branched-chain amino acid ABC transporter permease [Eubacteriales bacterium]